MWILPNFLSTCASNFPYLPAKAAISATKRVKQRRIHIRAQIRNDIRPKIPDHAYFLYILCGFSFPCAIHTEEYLSAKTTRQIAGSIAEPLAEPMTAFVFLFFVLICRRLRHTVRRENERGESWFPLSAGTGEGSVRIPLFNSRYTDQGCRLKRCQDGKDVRIGTGMSISGARNRS